MSTFKDNSRKEWEAAGTIETINAGSLQRIADAIEKMAGNYLQMERDLRWYREAYREKGKEIQRLCRSNAALRGHIKRLKAK